MARALDIMRGGLSAGTAKAINGTLSTAISAAGTTLGTATALVASINVVTTAAASSGVALPACELGDEVEILNLGANAVTVYPNTSSEQINAVAAGGGILLAVNTACKFRKFTSTRWIGYLSA